MRKTAYDVTVWLEYRRVLFRSPRPPPAARRRARRAEAFAGAYEPREAGEAACAFVRGGTVVACAWLRGDGGDTVTLPAEIGRAPWRERNAIWSPAGSRATRASR